MESQTTAPHAVDIQPGHAGISSFRGRNRALADQIRARLENERTALSQALAAFRAELTAKAA